MLEFSFTTPAAMENLLTKLAITSYVIFLFCFYRESIHVEIRNLQRDMVRQFQIQLVSCIFVNKYRSQVPK